LAASRVWSPLRGRVFWVIFAVFACLAIAFSIQKGYEHRLDGGPGCGPVTVTAGVASSNIPNALGFTVTIPAGFAARASEVNLNSDQLG
jgi:hypothetical protein